MDFTSHYYFLPVVAFVIGYFFITIEHITKVSKTAVALLMGVFCWILQFANPEVTISENYHFLTEHLASTSQVVFFLLGALTIVEIVIAHEGFYVISKYLHIDSKRRLLWISGFVAFFLSSVLDNLTTTIVMVNLIRRLLPEGEERLIFGGAIVIAANAGGAWTPIGDVTTTMLWIGGQLSTGAIMKSLFIPSIVCCTVAFAYLSLFLKGSMPQAPNHEPVPKSMQSQAKWMFALGIGCLVTVPIFKLLTGLPPVMGIVFGLSLMWLITDLMHRNDVDKEHLRVHRIMARVDLSSTLFFLGILLCVNALQSAGILQAFASSLSQHISNTNVIAIIIGLVSAIVDNVPLVAASMGMYGLASFPTDSSFWKMIAYCAGTGGSILVVGSAAGVAFMGIEKVDFIWYMRRIGVPAFLGYFAGIGVYFLLGL